MVTEKLVILILYYNFEEELRNTIVEHLKCFEKYSDHNVVYFNVAWGVPNWVSGVEVDLIIYHYTLCSRKWLNPQKNLFNQDMKRLSTMKGYKVAMPQDEYVYNNWVCKFFKEQGIQSIYTCFNPEDYQKAYPTELTGVSHLDTVLPGYLDEYALEEYRNKLIPHKDRKIDIGYRARKNPYYLGSLGILKHTIADIFNANSRNLKTDISTDPNSVFLGKSWYEFLLSCRCILGVESGSSLLDFDGSIRDRVLKFQNQCPEASFEECRDQVFPGLDNNINLATMSPRHFEAIITNTCQVLIKGRYADVLRADIDYIAVEKDFSNIEQVLTKIEDIKLCEDIAKNCFEHVLAEGKVTYRSLVNQVIQGVINIDGFKKATSNNTSELINKLEELHSNPIKFQTFLFLKMKLKFKIKNTLYKLRLLDTVLNFLGKKV